MVSSHIKLLTLIMLVFIQKSTFRFWIGKKKGNIIVTNHDNCKQLYETLYK